MVGLIDTHSYKWRLVTGSLLIISSLIFLALMPHLLGMNSKVQAASSSTTIKDPAIADSPNVITSSLYKTADGLNQVTNSAQQALNNSVHFVTEASINSGLFVAHGVGKSVSLTAKAAGSSLRFVGHTTGNIFGLMAKVPKISSIITPANDDKTPIPIINADADSLAENQFAPAAAQQATQPAQVDPAPQWPLHGFVTLEFGQSDWPFQKVHTGIDISDGRVGATPVHPFKPGIVVQAVSSSVGLGNHVVVDHGSGVTSVYGHLASISVSVGQQVDKNTVLGYEGSTGASTGPHVHFEIRVNGQPLNPRKFISGQP